MMPALLNVCPLELPPLPPEYMTPPALVAAPPGRVPVSSSSTIKPIPLAVGGHCALVPSPAAEALSAVMEVAKALKVGVVLRKLSPAAI